MDVLKVTAVVTAIKNGVVGGAVFEILGFGFYLSRGFDWDVVSGATSLYEQRLALSSLGNV